MRVILWCAAVLLVAMHITGPIVDPDLWWHITVGRWIIAHGAIPHEDYWNLFGIGKPWRAYSWSSEILYALLDGSFGVRGLLALQIALTVILAGSLYYVCARLAQDWFFGALIGAFSTAAIFDHLTLRPQLVVWIAFVWVLFVGESIAVHGGTARRYTALTLLFSLWANSHITTALGLAALGAWLWSRISYRELGKAVGAGFIGTLCTPYLGGEWLTFFSKTGHPLQMSAIAEFQPATILMYSATFPLLLAFLLLVLLFHSPRSVNRGALLLGGCFLLGAFAVVKFLPFAVFYLALLVGIGWRESRSSAGRELQNLRDGIRKLEELLFKLPLEGLSFLLLVLAFVQGYAVWRAPLNRSVIPVDAVSFIVTRKLPEPLLNDFGRGGYLMYMFSDPAGNPSRLVPIDGRTNVTPHEVWKKYLAAEMGKSHWHEYLELVKPSTILWRTESPLTSILRATGAWCEVFSSGNEEHGYTVFVSRDTLTARSDLASPDCAVVRSHPNELEPGKEVALVYGPARFEG